MEYLDNKKTDHSSKKWPSYKTNFTTNYLILIKKITNKSLALLFFIK